MTPTVDTDPRFHAASFQIGKADTPFFVSPDGTAFSPGTPAAAALALDALRRSTTQVRIFLGDQQTGEAWPEEHDVMGTIGRSMGPCKVPLLVPKDSHGGTALTTASVVGIMAKNGWRWRHPTLSFGTWEAVSAPFVSEDGETRYKAETRHNGSLHGRHATLVAARRLIAFMTGERFSA